MRCCSTRLLAPARVSSRASVSWDPSSRALPEPTRVTGVSTQTGKGSTSRPARVVIAADGRRSTLALALGLARHPRRPRRWAIGAYFEGVTGFLDVGEMHVRRRHYIGVAPVPGGLANACLVVPEARARAIGSASTEALEQRPSAMTSSWGRDSTAHAARHR